MPLSGVRISCARLASANSVPSAREDLRRGRFALRAFLRYAQQREWCPPGLAEGIHLPRLYRHETLPVGPPWDAVQRLLKQSEGDRPAKIRDRLHLDIRGRQGHDDERRDSPSTGGQRNALRVIARRCADDPALGADGR